MSIQAIAGFAYDRRHPASPTRIARQQAAQETAQRESGQGATPNQNAAKQVNTALETLKRYIPTELLALYMPFISITQDHAVDASPGVLRWTYLGFVLATPVVVWVIYVAKAAEAGESWSWKSLPYFEGLLALVAFAVWGASVPGVFLGQQWWISLVALSSAVVLPLVDSAFGKKA